MVFFVIESQVNNGSGALLTFSFDNRPDAEAKYHTLLAVAAKSAVQKHGVMLCTEDLFVLKQEVYTHFEEAE